MKFDVDLPELERQRYEDIKSSDNYLELNILIGVEKENKSDGCINNIPVIQTTMHHCTSDEISCLYAILQNLKDRLEKDYPMECLVSKLGIKISSIGSVEIPIESDSEEDKKEEK